MRIDTTVEVPVEDPLSHGAKVECDRSERSILSPAQMTEGKSGETDERRVQ
jgi:positive regulator of sigma E activity